jgi:hypothetical protein
VDHRGARRLGELARRDERGEDRGTDDLAPLVDDEAPVGVAVEGQAQVRPGLHDLGLQVAGVLRLDRVGLVVGEAAVELEVQLGGLQRQPGEDGRHGVAAHAVAGVDDDLQRPQVRQARDQRLEVVAVAGQQVLLRDAPGGPVGRRQPGVEEALGVGTDLAQPAVLPHRGGARAAELDAVVLRGVVAGGEHAPGTSSVPAA